MRYHSFFFGLATSITDLVLLLPHSANILFIIINWRLNSKFQKIIKAKTQWILEKIFTLFAQDTNLLMF